MSQGLAAAARTEETMETRYVLPTDATVTLGPAPCANSPPPPSTDDRALPSQMALLLRAEMAWERVIVPAFVYFFAQLYLFRRVNDPASRIAAGLGGCMLIRRPP